jgi:predicted metal-dependent HD superfamily phosphohydrolase
MTQTRELVKALTKAAHTYYGRLPYHNWQHVCKVSTNYEDLYGTLPTETGLAIAYHDAIYVPGAHGTNESMSALAFLHELRKLTATDPSFDKLAVVNMIEATKVANHVSATYVPDTIETARVLDCDLSALATPDYMKFLDNQNNILIEVLGREFAVASDEKLADYRRQQANFMRQFLQRPFVYHTAEARVAYEELARTNILKYVYSWS